MQKEIKLKNGIKKALFPLYQEHTKYLLRMLKTVTKGNQKKITRFHKNIKAWRDVATCHEVALNSLKGVQIETHQNKRGKEKEYTNHPKAKHVSRNKRVRIIWDMLKQELDKNPTLSGIEPYKDVKDRHILTCPFCDEVWLERHTETMLYYGYEDDDDDYEERTWWEWEAGNCEHFLSEDTWYYDVFDGDELRQLKTILEKKAEERHEEYITELTVDLETFWNIYEGKGLLENPSKTGDIAMFIDDWQEFVNFILKEIKENDIEYLIKARLLY